MLPFAGPSAACSHLGLRHTQGVTVHSASLHAEPRAVHYSDLGGIEAVLADIRELVEHPLRHPEASHQNASLLITRHAKTSALVSLSLPLTVGQEAVKTFGIHVGWVHQIDHRHAGVCMAWGGSAQGRSPAWASWLRQDSPRQCNRQ
jgi:hypothetical protein